VVRPMLTVTATLDHRFVDGFQAATLAKSFRRTFEDPWSLDRPVQGADEPGDAPLTASP
jgi:pyruvate/2-oxoglutarate dehydrogenase complex dihydrolipoamide acyltransferase (E2) component